MELEIAQMRLGRFIVSTEHSAGHQSDIPCYGADRWYSQTPKNPIHVDLGAVQPRPVVRGFSLDDRTKRKQARK